MSGVRFSSYFEKLKSDWVKSQSLRQLLPPQGIDFCSNDYLGFSDRKDLHANILMRMQEVGLGSTGSRLLRGHNQCYLDFEKTLADFSGMECSLFFPSGYQANLALFSGLLKTDAVVFSDERIHASIIDGIRLSGCEKYIWPHNDLNHLEMLLKQKIRSDKLNVVVVESIYSMTGEFAPLQELATLCEKYGAELIVDEAHSTGLFGRCGAGRVDELSLNDQVFAKVHTAGKALGVSGAWVAGSTELIQLLVNRSRPFIYSTAPAAYQQMACDESIKLLKSEFQELKEKFEGRVIQFQKFLRDKTENSPFQVSGWGSPVTALICGDNGKALQFAKTLQSHNFDVRAIRPPSVPEDESLLRITLPLSRTDAEIASFQTILERTLSALVEGELG